MFLKACSNTAGPRSGVAWEMAQVWSRPRARRSVNAASPPALRRSTPGHGEAIDFGGARYEGVPRQAGPGHTGAGPANLRTSGPTKQGPRGRASSAALVPPPARASGHATARRRSRSAPRAECAARVGGSDRPERVRSAPKARWTARARLADRLHAAREVPRRLRLDDQVDVIALRRVVRDAEAPAVAGLPQGSLEDAHEPGAAERRDPAANAQRHVARVRTR